MMMVIYDEWKNRYQLGISNKNVKFQFPQLSRTSRV